MTQRLDVEKAVQAVGVLLRREGKRAGRLRLLKLLYIADREALKQTGVPILGSKIVAMQHGPLHSEILDLINGNHIQEALWSRHFRNVGRDVLLDEEPETGKLSRYEIELLIRVADERLDLEDYDLAVETHGFKEWVEVYHDPTEKTSRPIPIELLIDSVDRSADKAAILQDMKDSEAFDRLFAGICTG
jgi:uncharacterized phage-associated protein